MNQIHPYQKTSNLSTINLQYKRFSLLGIIWLFFLVSIQAACPNTEMLDLGFTGNGTATMKVVEVEDASHYQIV